MIRKFQARGRNQNGETFNNFIDKKKNRLRRNAGEFIKAEEKQTREKVSTQQSYLIIPKKAEQARNYTINKKLNMIR